MITFAATSPPALPLQAPDTQKPAITPVMCDRLFNFLCTRVLLLQSQGAKLEVWRTDDDAIYHARFAGRVLNSAPADTAILLDLVEEIADRSSILFRRLYASFALDVQSSAC